MIARTFLAIFFATSSFAQTSGIRTYCNPIDVDYKYNFEQINENISYRSAADPVIVNHKGEYYLFATISGGWWHSKDLVHWDFVVPDKWPFMYFGSSNVFPLYGIELDPKKRLTYIGKSKPLLILNPDQHGWERFGQDHRDATRPYVEGAAMTKHGGRYYLMYR